MTRPPLDRSALADLLATAGSTWSTVDVVAETGSTNADLLRRAAAGDDIGWTVLAAEHQTAGRGRNGRVWSTVPRSQLTFSVGVPTSLLPTAAWGWVPLVTGLAVVEAIRAGTGVHAGLKWPNDVLAVGGGKLAGILAEVATPAAAIVVGIGLNVSLRSDELPDVNATSLAVLGATDVDRTELLAAVLAALARRFTDLAAAGEARDALVADYAANSLTISSRVRATLPGDRQVVGDALAIDEQGRLRIDTGSEVVVVSAGDIVHLRPV